MVASFSADILGRCWGFCLMKQGNLNVIFTVYGLNTGPEFIQGVLFVLVHRLSKLWDCH
jgi:hypothetical protein